MMPCEHQLIMQVCSSMQRWSLPSCGPFQPWRMMLLPCLMCHESWGNCVHLVGLSSVCLPLIPIICFWGASSGHGRHAEGKKEGPLQNAVKCLACCQHNNMRVDLVQTPQTGCTRLGAAALPAVEGDWAQLQQAARAAHPRQDAAEDDCHGCSHHSSRPQGSLPP